MFPLPPTTLDKEQANMDSSPTGKPIISPRALPLIIALWAGVNAAAQALPEGKMKHGLLVGLAILGPALGILAPGIRKPV